MGRLGPDHLRGDHEQRALVGVEVHLVAALALELDDDRIIDAGPLDQRNRARMWPEKRYDLMFRAIDEIALLDALTTDVDISLSWLRWFISSCISNMSTIEI